MRALTAEQLAIVQDLWRGIRQWKETHRGMLFCPLELDYRGNPLDNGMLIFSKTKSDTATKLPRDGGRHGATACSFSPSLLQAPICYVLDCSKILTGVRYFADQMVDTDWKPRPVFA